MTRHCSFGAFRPRPLLEPSINVFQLATTAVTSSPPPALVGAGPVHDGGPAEPYYRPVKPPHQLVDYLTMAGHLGAKHLHLDAKHLHLLLLSSPQRPKLGRPGLERDDGSLRIRQRRLVHGEVFQANAHIWDREAVVTR